MSMKIKTLSTTEVREKISDVIDVVLSSGTPIVVGRRNVPEVVLVPFPRAFNGTLSEMTNINAYSKSFDFLSEEPELYSREDIKKRHA
jgi:antitoxin (DNA-binding transcriptional repressor) of toxin-antitoxin stability system